MNESVRFFEKQFARQVREREFELNPFEKRALPHLKGRVLDLGCGLGNLSLAAARQGHAVVAVDGSPTAVARLAMEAKENALPIQALRADLQDWSIPGNYDTIVAIGLLMFFRKQRALDLLSQIQERVNPGGRVIVNALIEGTTFFGMFDGDNYYLFRAGELEERFADWMILSSTHDSFPAPGNTRKEFATVIAEKTAAPNEPVTADLSPLI